MSKPRKPIDLEELRTRTFLDWNDFEALIAEVEYLRDRLADFGEWPECAECGCTDSQGCLGGCYWVTTADPLICSICADQQ